MQSSLAQAHRQLVAELGTQRKLNVDLAQQVKKGLQQASAGQREADRANTRGRLGLNNSLQEGQAYKQALLNSTEGAASIIFRTDSSSSHSTGLSRY